RAVSSVLCVFKNPYFCFFVGHHSFLFWLLHERGRFGSWASQHHFLRLDQCGHHYLQLPCHPTFARLMIEVKNLHKSFKEEEILKGINTLFEKGKTNLIICQSGSGKTVFLKCLLGLFTPEEGEIFYDGREYSSFSEEEQRDLREHMGMVFQGGALFDSMTVAE